MEEFSPFLLGTAAALLDLKICSTLGKDSMRPAEFEYTHSRSQCPLFMSELHNVNYHEGAY